MKHWIAVCMLITLYINMIDSKSSGNNKKVSDQEINNIVQRTVEKVLSKFWYSVKNDRHVQAALRYVNGCHFRKLVQSVEHDKNFKKLKILLAKNGIIDLSYRKLVPMKHIMSKIPKSDGKDFIPDLTSFVSDIEDLLQNLPPGTLNHYNLKHSTIGRRIEEASLSDVIRYYVDEILTLPQTNTLFHELIRLSFNVDEFIEIVFAYFGVYDKNYQEDMKVTYVTQITEGQTTSYDSVTEHAKHENSKDPDDKETDLDVTDDGDKAKDYDTDMDKAKDKVDKEDKEDKEFEMGTSHTELDETTPQSEDHASIQKEQATIEENEDVSLYQKEETKVFNSPEPEKLTSNTPIH